MKIEEFKDYVWSFYGEDGGIYKDFFNNNLKIQEVEKAIEIRLAITDLVFVGDSIDREIVRDIIFKLRNPALHVEYEHHIESIPEQIRNKYKI